ncbi:unnamed protein product [Microthlaspi erraticum]|uniref:Uncharacterized protein n=1 Tax=Microthlaspi erraticum TaxID=1685480 RepID=A0A6D2JSS1_9BRAS|nr:unnamed protein product [Microthlaspi erraticum]
MSSRNLDRYQSPFSRAWMSTTSEVGGVSEVSSKSGSMLLNLSRKLRSGSSLSCSSSNNSWSLQGFLVLMLSLKSDFQAGSALVLRGGISGTSSRAMVACLVVLDLLVSSSGIGSGSSRGGWFEGSITMKDDAVQSLRSRRKHDLITL